MSRTARALVAVSVAAFALGVAGAALAAYNPQVVVTSSPRSVTVGYRQGNDDDATARITFFAPLGSEANLAQPVGTQLGTAVARVFVTTFQTQATLSGPVVMGSAADPTLQGTALLCTGTATHDAIWILRVAVATSAPLDIPAFVDRATGPTASFASLTITVCFRSPYVSEAEGGAPQGNRPLEAQLTLNRVFSFAPSAQARWTGLFIPYAPGTKTANPLNAAESQAIAANPVALSLKGKPVAKTKTVRRNGRTRRVKTYWARLAGKLSVAGGGVGDTRVVIRAHKKNLASAQTRPSGSFSMLVRLPKTTIFTAIATRPATSAQGTCQPLIPLSLMPLVTPRCTGVTTGAVSAARGVRVRKPKTAR